MLKLNKIYCMDCLEGMREIPDKSVDLVLTDPPYGIGKEEVYGDEDLTQYYRVLPELFRVLKDNSFFVCFSSIGRLPEFFHNNPFNYRWQFIIYINNGMVRGSVGFNRYICVLIFMKGNPKQNKPLLDVMEVSTSSQECAKREHPTQKRLDVCQKIVNTFSSDSDLIVDPFMGSGTTAVACKLFNRDFIGFEINPEYVKIAEKRLEQEVLRSWI